MAKLTIITPRDCDGAVAASIQVSASGLDKEEINIYTAGRTSILKTLGYAVMRGLTDELVVLGIEPVEKGLRVASAFDTVRWYDHHEVREVFSPAGNVSLFMDSGADSTSSLLASTLGIEGNLVTLADEIDSGEVSRMEARLLRGAMHHIRCVPQPRERDECFFALIHALVHNGINALVGPPYINWFQMVEAQTTDSLPVALETLKERTVGDLRVAFLDDIGALPVYSISESLRESGELYDVMVFKRTLDPRRPTSEVEFRTHTGKNVWGLASMLGGGGRPHAAGARVEGDLTGESIFSLISLPDLEL